MVKGLDLEPREEVTTTPRFGNWNGGRILRTALPLIFISLIIGYALDVSGLSPFSLWRGLLDWFVQSWADLFGHLPNIGAAFLQIGGWLLMGAAVAVPIWLVIALSRRMLGKP